MHTDLDGQGFVELNDRSVDYSDARHRQKETANTIGNGANASVHGKQVGWTNDCGSQFAYVHPFSDA
jgi:hypothetical protein